jgi:prepilin-type N-terminal cleavage/methylation domain-containing protein
MIFDSSELQKLEFCNRLPYHLALAKKNDKRLRKRVKSLSNRGFTIIELLVVIVIIGSMSFLLSSTFGAFTSWKEERFLREFTEKIQFLHQQAIADQVPYQMEIDLQDRSYHIGILRGESDVNRSSAVSTLAATNTTGTLSLELADFLNPYNGDGQTMIPPPGYPSLYEKEFIPNGMILTDLKVGVTTHAANESEAVFISFQPQGFTDFAVFHFTLTNQSIVTILINPFSGEAKIFRGFRDFEWSFGRNSQ